MIVVDASALLAFLFKEPGHDQVGSAIDAGAVMSTVNLSEVLGRFARDGHDTGEILERLLASPITFVPFDQEHARRAAELLPATRPLGLSLGDRSCLALAQSRGTPALTADRVWLEAELGIEVLSIR